MSEPRTDQLPRWKSQVVGGQRMWVSHGPDVLPVAVVTETKPGVWYGRVRGAPGHEPSWAHLEGPGDLPSFIDEVEAIVKDMGWDKDE